MSLKESFVYFESSLCGAVEKDPLRAEKEGAVIAQNQKVH